MSGVDPVELLDLLGPPVGWAARTDVADDPVAADILARVVARAGGIVTLESARRRRRAIAGVAVVAALTVGGAVAALWHRAPSETRQVTCWSQAADPPAARFVAVWDGLGDPTELCASAWAEGRLVPDVPGAPAPTELRACVTADGLTAVIPGGPGVCSALGLVEYATPSAGSPAEPAGELARRVNAAQRELDSAFLPGTNCVPPADAEGVARRVLDEHGLRGWDITIDGTSGAAEGCATVALDLGSTTAFVRPVPRPG